MKRLIVYTVSALLMASCGGHKQTVRTVPDGSESAIYDSKSDYMRSNQYSEQLVKEARKWLGTKYRRNTAWHRLLGNGNEYIPRCGWNQIAPEQP